MVVAFLAAAVAEEAAVAGNRRHSLHRLNQWWLRYEYRHTAKAILWIVLFLALIATGVVTWLLDGIEQLGYAGAFIGGILSVSLFTTAPAVVVLVDMAAQPHLQILPLAIVATIGTVVGDAIILKFLENKMTAELRPLIRKLRIDAVVRRLRHSRFRWVLVLVGAIVLATPLPDEAGLALMSASKLGRHHVLLICLVLNFIGMWLLMVAARAIIT